MAVNCYLAITNLLGIPAAEKAQGSEKFMVWLIMLASTLMHATETKHYLTPLLLRGYSQTLLNFDRLITYTFTPYFIWRAYCTGVLMQRDAQLVATIGVLALRLGEIRTINPVFNNIVYPLLHTVWHAAVYRLLYTLV